MYNWIIRKNKRFNFWIAVSWARRKTHANFYIQSAIDRHRHAQTRTNKHFITKTWKKRRKIHFAWKSCKFATHEKIIVFIIPRVKLDCCQKKGGKKELNFSYLDFVHWLDKLFVEERKKNAVLPRLIRRMLLLLSLLPKQSSDSWVKMRQFCVISFFRALFSPQNRLWPQWTCHVLYVYRCRHDFRILLLSTNAIAASCHCEADLLAKGGAMNVDGKSVKLF